MHQYPHLSARSMYLFDLAGLLLLALAMLSDDGLAVVLLVLTLRFDGSDDLGLEVDVFLEAFSSCSLTACLTV